MGKIKNAKPLLIDGIQFRSTLETTCYLKLKENNIPFEYEKYKIQLIPSFKFNGTAFESKKKKKSKIFGEIKNDVHGIQYIPDFVGNGWIIECKGYPNEAFPLKWKILKWRLSELAPNVRLFLPSNRQQIEECIKIILDGRKGIL
jgi:hypothetical protein